MSKTVAFVAVVLTWLFFYSMGLKTGKDTCKTITILELLEAGNSSVGNWISEHCKGE